MAERLLFQNGFRLGARMMQPLRRSYAITEERIETMPAKGSLFALYHQAKVEEPESLAEPTGKDPKKLESYQNNQSVYAAIVAALKAAVSDKVYYSPAAFMPVLTKVLASVTDDKKLPEKIADGLSVMEKRRRFSVTATILLNVVKTLYKCYNESKALILKFEKKRSIHF